METTQKQTEEMIAAVAGATIQPEKVTELASTLLSALGKPARKSENTDSADQTDAAAN